MKLWQYAAIAIALAIGNVAYCAIRGDIETAFERSYFQTSALIVAWIVQRTINTKDTNATATH